jgi:hypothetical protein
MIICSGYPDMTLSTNEIFISQEMVTTAVAKPGKQNTDNIVPEIIQIIHAAE